MQFNIKVQNDFIHRPDTLHRPWLLCAGMSVGEVLRCYCEDVLPMLPQAHS